MIPDHPMTAAMHYARQGFAVFPCKPSKQPATRNGFKDATTDLDQIRTWWVDDPDYLIGVATGGAPTGLLVLDLDSYKPGGTPEFDAHSAVNGGLTPTLVTQTGQGGRHHWYRIDGYAPCAIGLFPNVDVRADGGYVIVPPSVSDYGVYTVVDDLPIAPCPAWLVDLVRDSKKTVAVTSPHPLVVRDDLSPEDQARCDHYASTVFELEAARLRECASAAVSRYGVEKYTGPEWDRTTFEVACNLLEIVNSPWNSLAEADAFALLTTHAPRDPGFGDADVVRCWNSARKIIGTDKTRPMPAASGGGMFIPFATPTPSTANPASFFPPGQGLDALLLASAVLDLGPLAIDATENRGIWSYRNGVWIEAPKEVVDRVAVLLGPRFRTNHVTTVLPVIHQQLAANGMIITCEPVSDWINVRNGMLHWRSGQLYPHDPSFLSTVQLPVEWDESAVCPAFDTFVGQVMPADAHAYLWEIIGYLIYSGNPLQRAFLFHGSGINGKGTLIRVLMALLGAQNVSTVTLSDIVESRFEVASLHGKIANLAGDIDATYMKNTAKFKAITGEDTISAERKYEHSFRFRCWAVPVFSANEFWKSADTTTGYKRRWQLLPFPNSFTIEGGQGLSERLSAETAGILVHAVRGLRDLMDRGDFDPPQSARDEKEKFELAADQVSEWLREDISVTVADPTNVLASYPAADAYKAYRLWAENNGNGALPSSKWWGRMETLGYTRRKSGVMRITGLTIDQRQNVIDWARATN